MDTRQRSVLTVLSAVKIVDVIIMNGYSLGWVEVSMRVVVVFSNHYALKFEKNDDFGETAMFLKITPLLFC